MTLAPPLAKTYQRPTAITADHITVSFASGNSVMDSWLKKHALGNEGKASRTYVVTERSNVVIAYYSLAMGGILVSDLPRRLRHDNPKQVPVTVLGQLAVDAQHAGRGLGGSLLREALSRTYQVAHSVGVRGVLVHAIDDLAERFYRRYGFVALPGGMKTLILPIESIEMVI